MALATTNELRALLPFLTPRERAELDELLGAGSQATEYATLPFAEFCERCLVVQDKQGELVPFQPNRVQLALVNALTGHDLVLKARQVGISTVIQAWFFYKAMRGNARTLTLCHDDELTADIRAMADRYYEHYPEDGRPARKYANAKLTTYPQVSSQCRIATVGDVRGHTAGNVGGFYDAGVSVFASATTPEVVYVLTYANLTPDEPGAEHEGTHPCAALVVSTTDWFTWQRGIEGARQ